MALAYVAISSLTPMLHTDDCPDGTCWGEPGNCACGMELVTG